MTRSELMEKIGYKSDQLINTSNGAMDVLAVSETHVFFGFLAHGKSMSEPISKFIARFEQST